MRDTNTYSVSRVTYTRHLLGTSPEWRSINVLRLNANTLLNRRVHLQRSSINNVASSRFSYRCGGIFQEPTRVELFAFKLSL